MPFRVTLDFVINFLVSTNMARYRSYEYEIKNCIFIETILTQDEEFNEDGEDIKDEEYCSDHISCTEYDTDNDLQSKLRY